jgi:hypothetical protein
MDRTGVSCSDLEQSAGCDRCRDRVRQWLDKQESSSWEWQQVQELFDKLQRRCVACCLQGNLGGYSEWQKHKTMQCKAHAGMTGLDLDQFQQGIHDRGGIHSCQQC